MHKSIKRSAITFGAAISLLFARVALAAPDASAQPSMAAKPPPSALENFISDDIHAERRLCGVYSAYVVLRDLGRNPDLHAIRREIPPSLYGSSMAQLNGYLSGRGLNCVGAQLGARELYDLMEQQPDTRAIANVHDHWLVIRGARDNDFFVVDFPKMFHIPVSALESRWDGHVIIATATATTGIPRGSGLLSRGALWLGVLGLMGLASAYALRFFRSRGLVTETRLEGGATGHKPPPLGASGA